ncbi:Uncharacterized protein dnm_007460 [Desulfonema magnum]|uniref:Uncharacterized protein n=1 Tax=Desulfonema magnum TaxID=45655 RepID=A0A975GKI4_9BACT|nr:Uncharacterized protein dnm_007460 [Desulfonema magnum]
MTPEKFFRCYDDGHRQLFFIPIYLLHNYHPGRYRNFFNEQHSLS